MPPCKPEAVETFPVLVLEMKIDASHNDAIICNVISMSSY